MTSFWNAPAWSMGVRSSSVCKKQDIITPGPGNYGVSSSYNSNFHGCKIGRSKRSGTKDEKHQPGPGQYNLSGNNNGPKISLANKYKGVGESQTQFGPGPGNYNPNSQAINKNPSAFTMGAKHGTGKIQDPQPGPGCYNASTDQLGKTGGKIGNSKRTDLSGNGQTPGPGKYNSACSRPFSAGPKYKFGASGKSFFAGESKPGPGQYDVLNDNFVSSLNKGCTMGHRYDQQKKQDKISNPGPGYYNTADQKHNSGTKIGKSLRNSVNQYIGPGPGAYNSSYKYKNGPECKIGFAKRSNQAKRDTPGPGAYDMLKNSMSGVTISGAKGSHHIDLTPGPGTYNPSLQGAKGRPCSAQIGRGLRSSMRNLDTPGPGQYYHHEGMKYKFAYTKQLRSKEIMKKQPGPGQYEIPSTVPSAPHYLIGSYQSVSKI